MRLIDADALKEVINRRRDLFNGCTHLPEKARRDELLQVIVDINNAPTVDAEPVRRGKWEYHLMPLAKKCSLCGERVAGKSTWIFCPNCGAKMEDSI